MTLYYKIKNTLILFSPIVLPKIQNMTTTQNIIQLLNFDDSPIGVIGSPSSSFEAIIDIRDINEKAKLLGELVCFTVTEGNNNVLVLGQITEIETKNRWHEEPAFKGIIKRHGRLPNLSGEADNRIAKINVQSSFILEQNESKAHKLANSPSTGISVKKISNEIMQKLMAEFKDQLISLGRAYDTDIKIPFWFKHFGQTQYGGSGDAYHIGVFGRTGSGKTTTAANMILGYARNYKHMSILILDPQEQFYEDNNILPDGKKFEDEIRNTGMEYEKYRIPDDVALPNNPKLFSEILANDGDFMKHAFDILSEDKCEAMKEAIELYVEDRLTYSKKIITDNPDKLFRDLLTYFLNEKKTRPIEPLKKVYSQPHKIEEVKNSIRDNLASDRKAKEIWERTCKLFSEEKKILFEAIIKEVVEKPGNTIILNISGRSMTSVTNELTTRFVNLIEDAIKEAGANLYAASRQANCLVVLDEAHRFTSSYDGEAKKLTHSIVDAVRTTRKYGIGYMFITQTIDSLDAEIRRQIRIFAFGYGLTSGSEFGKVKETINDDSGAKFYRSFIDPSSNNKFPFMFYGPISPLSFTGAPLFLEMDGLISELYETK